MKIRQGLFILSLLLTSLFFKIAEAQTNEIDYKKLLQIPLQYTILKTTDRIAIDGKDDEACWSKAPWTKFFSEIENGTPTETKTARCKMLWDNDYLYVFALLKESNLWATFTEHDSQVFQDNAFEIFINPDGSNFNYFEFQINANGTVWDLFMPKPYRNGGKNLTSWDIKGLKKAIQLNGSLNNPSDTDNSWSIELAIPLKSVSLSGNEPPKTGTIWRMNFSRVQWDLDTLNGKYFRRHDSITGKLSAEHYYVWSPQGISNLHYPERWGYVMFSDKLMPGGFLSEQTENRKLILWKYYYLQQEFKKEHGKYARKINQLNKMYKGDLVLHKDKSKIKMYADEHQFLIECFFPESNQNLSIDQEGELHIEKVVK